MTTTMMKTKNPSMYKIANRKAQPVVEQSPSITVRPMVLEDIPELAELYRTVLESVIKRSRDDERFGKDSAERGLHFFECRRRDETDWFGTGDRLRTTLRYRSPLFGTPQFGRRSVSSQERGGKVIARRT